LKSTIAIALLATTVFFNANAEDKKLEKNETSAASSSLANYKMSNLKVGMYEVGNVNSMKLNFTLTKDADKIAVVKLMDENGTVLTQERIGKKETACNFRFDFSESASGKYFIEVTNGNHIITKEILKGKGTLSY
uniref:T9SS type A sorting domain-containing protein n=1 Tax=Emticicia sp. TaxID=1930953 RepID=UPI003BA6165C